MLGCEISNSEGGSEGETNIAHESIEEDNEKNADVKEDSAEMKQLILNSMYTEDLSRKEYDTGEYLKLGDSMSIYVQMPEGNNELIQEVSVEDYFIIEVEDIETNQKS